MSQETLGQAKRVKLYRSSSEALEAAGLRE